MKEMKYIYGPVPSRRLGISLGISPIPKKTCNYSCIYCQLGRTNYLTNTREMFFPVEKIIAEFDEVIKEKVEFDVVTIVGEGEPTLYLGLGELIEAIKKRTEKPVVVITNGALLYDYQVQIELNRADIVLPTMDAYDEVSFKKINRPYGKIKFKDVFNGLKDFSKEYQGQLWIELMLVKDVNDDDEALKKYATMIKSIVYDRLYINTVVRPPTELFVKAVEHEKMIKVAEFLGGISIDMYASQDFHSEISDDYEAVISIIKRHPMNQIEIERFLKTRECKNSQIIFSKLNQDNKVILVNYKGYDTYRLK